MKNDGPQDQAWPLPYGRPNQTWVCGRTDSVHPCPLGPDIHGRCQTTSECKPALDKEKKRYKCTRRPQYGGPCDEGPLPTGVCGHPVPPCVPIRSTRSRRALFSCWVLSLTIATLLLLLHGKIQYKFINPGSLSAAHARPKGEQAGKYRSEENCGACHHGAGAGLRNWVKTAAGADRHPFDFAAFVRPTVETPKRMDATCTSKCHTDYQFHNVNLKEDQSCLKCHMEHRGDDGLRVKSAQQCVNCHGNVRRMDEVTAGLFTGTVHGGGGPARPSAPITRFSNDHPEFRPIALRMKDPNTLRFNHKKHLTKTVMETEDQGKMCAKCHKEDAMGEYHQRIRFKQHCYSCHSLQFDIKTPELELPHGDAEFVKAFLGNLRQEYEQLLQKSAKSQSQVRDGVNEKMKNVQEEQLAGISIEEGVFFSRTRRLEPTGRVVPFYGCAYCHEVKGSGNSIEVVAADVPARWLPKGAFHHRAHRGVSCTTCHNAVESTQTSDILLPSVKTCARCHQSNAAPGEGCTLCHSYHWKDQPTRLAEQ
jgi:hypothetical protein